MRIVFVDPGTVTGIFWTNCEEGIGWEEWLEVVRGGVERGEWFQGSSSEVERLVKDLDPAVVVCEDFQLRGDRLRGREALDPVRVAESLRSWLRAHLWRGRWEWQQASDAKAVVTDKRLRRWGLWIPGNPHARDAIRHALLWQRRQSG